MGGVPGRCSDKDLSIPNLIPNGANIYANRIIIEGEKEELESCSALLSSHTITQPFAESWILHSGSSSSISVEQHYKILFLIFLHCVCKRVQIQSSRR